MSDPLESARSHPPSQKNSRRTEILAYVALAVSFLALLMTLTHDLRRRAPVESSASRSEVTVQVPPSQLRLDESTLDQISTASARAIETANRSVVRVEVSFSSRVPQTDELETYFGSIPPEQLGSGVVVDSGGFVLTNYHVVRGADTVSVVRFDGSKHTATIVGHDPLSDLAVLNVPNLNLPGLSWADSDRVAVGNLVWAIGTPHGLDQSVSMGVVSSTNRRSMLDSPFQDFLQIDAAINPGNSGGALIDVRGHLIGITTAITGESFSGIGFALPSNSAKRVFEQLREHGDLPRGWIGLQLGVVTPARAAMANLDRPFGAYVESLIPGETSPARTAGLQVADICIRFNGKSISGPLGLIRQVANHPIGTSAILSVVRDDAEIEIEVLVSQRP